MRVHIGNRVWKPGNVGDEWMLAGFLEAWRSLDPHGMVTCATIHPEGAPRIRFPGVEWITSDWETRFEAVRDCDVWLALGGAPFEAKADHPVDAVLCPEPEWCLALKKPMFYLGAGVSDPAALDNPRLRKVIKAAERIWTRDAASAAALRNGSTLAKVRLGADLAHIYFSESTCAEAPLAEAAHADFETIFGWAVDAQEVDASSAVALEQALRAYPGVAHCWLGAKDWPVAPDSCAGAEKSSLQHCAVHVTSMSVDGLTARWPSCRTVVTDRPHCALWGAWNGSRLVAVGGKSASTEIEHSLGCERVENLSDIGALKRAIGGSRSVPPARLLELSALAFESCREFHQAALSATTATVNERQSAQRPARSPSSLSGYAERIREFFGWGEVAGASVAERQRR